MLRSTPEQRGLMMARKIFFGRHGHNVNSGEYGVTPGGFHALGAICNRLRLVRFFPQAAVSSSETRCVQTASFLNYNEPPLCIPLLHAYGNMQKVGIVIDKDAPPRWLSAHEYAAEALAAVLAAVPGDKSLVVIAHDCIPLLLAYRYLELHGVSVDWKHTLPQFPLKGEGVLVEGECLAFFRHISGEV